MKMKMMGLVVLAMLLAMGVIGVTYGAWSQNLVTGMNVDMATAPSVTTTAATNITNTGATLNGNLTALGSGPTVKVYFEWGLTPSYGNKTADQFPSSTPAFSANITGLTLGQTYYFKAVAVAGFLANGDRLSFTTSNPLSITTTTLPNGKKNKGYGDGTSACVPSYPVYVSATGGLGSYAWAIISGSLPPGLTLNSSSGRITGTSPNTNDSTYTFTVQVTDSANQKASKELSIKVTN